MLLYGLPAGLFVAWIYPILPWKGFNLCAVRYILGMNCPGCGFVRSVAMLLHGNIQKSVSFNPMGIVGVILISVIWINEFVIGYIFKREVRVGAAGIRIVGIAFVAGLFVQWFIYLYINLIM